MDVLICPYHDNKLYTNNFIETGLRYCYFIHLKHCKIHIQSEWNKITKRAKNLTRSIMGKTVQIEIIFQYCMIIFVDTCSKCTYVRFLLNNLSKDALIHLTQLWNIWIEKKVLLKAVGFVFAECLNLYWQMNVFRDMM